MKGIKEYFTAVRFALGFAFRFVPGLTVAIGVFFMLASVIPYGNSFVLGKLVNEIVTGANSGLYRNISLLLILYAALNTMPHIFSNIRRYILRHWRLKMNTEMEVFFLKKREEIDIAHHENPSFLDLLQRSFRNGSGPIFSLTEGQFNFLWDLTSFVVGTILAVHFNPLVYVVVIVSAIPGFIADIKFASKGWSIWAKDSPEQRRLADLRWHFTVKTNVIETKLFQSGKKLLDWVRSIMTDFNHKQLLNEKSRLWASSSTDIIAFGGLALGLFLVVREVTGGDAEVGSIVYMLGVLATVKNSINSLLADISVQYEDALIVQDMKGMVETKPIVIDQKNPKKLDLDTAPEIVFENVSFKYIQTEKWILKNVSLTFKPGEKIGLVGNNGAGKTTLVKLLCRIYDPTEGRILVNGIDLKEISIQEWWSYLSVMFQDYASYDFLAKEAIAVGRSEVPLDINRVKNAAEVSQARAFIEEWEHKYNHQIGVEFKGVEPSKGQRQKLSIAKVIYRNARVMILDEPTASIDAESEAKIFDSLGNLSKDTTALLISHDFSTISECNRIFVLDEGKLIEQGNHEELIKLSGKYAGLYNLQAKRFKK